MTDSGEIHPCPWDGCDREFDSERSMKLHHAHGHGERLAREVVECAQCGEEMEVYSSRLDKGERQFCSSDCQGSWLSENRSGEDSYHWEDRVAVECAWCGEEMEVYPSRAESSDRHFCTDDCQNEWLASRTGEDAPAWEGGRVELECDWCGNIHEKVRNRAEEGEHNFCDKQCYGQWLSAQGGVEVECAYCADDLLRSPSEVEQYENHFCSRDCQAAWRRESDEYGGENHPNWAGGTTKVECDWCGEPLERQDWELEEQEHHFCDVDCMGEWRAAEWDGEGHHQYARVDVECAWCGDQLSRKPCIDERNERHFCDRECHSMWQSESDEYGGENHPKWNRVEKECAWCSDTVHLPPSWIDDQERFFCDGECMGRWRSENIAGESHPSWEGGSRRCSERIRRRIGPVPWYRAREWAIENAGGECEMCGSTYRPSAHHIIPLVAGGTHHQDLLMVLCPSCHNTVETYTKRELDDYLPNIADFAD